MEIIIYGAGRMGKACLQFLRKHKIDALVNCFCDANANDILQIEDKSVITYQDSLKLRLPYVIAVKKELSRKIAEDLHKDDQAFYAGLDKLVVDEMHLMDRTTYEREFCAVSHIESMDDYFDVADSNEGLACFWGRETVFRAMFNRLDLESVVELACGRGRHVPNYIEKTGHVTLVDILDKNIDICKMRYANDDRISYVVNNGYDLSQLEDDMYTSLFSYDSMVHFELLDIANYLSETYRILKKGGMALFHHSNNYSDYRASYADAIESRSFMSDKVFAYLAYRAGFEVVEQKLIDWNNHRDLDCLTLVEKK